MKLATRRYYDPEAEELIASAITASVLPAFGFCFGIDVLSCKNSSPATRSWRFLVTTFLISGISRGIPSFEMKKLLGLTVISNSSRSSPAEM